MNFRRISLADATKDLPSEWPHDPLPAIKAAMRELRQKIVVLDDDPTGTQAVHDFPVLTEWSVETLVQEMANDLEAFCVLTNSRGLSLAEAQRLNLQIGRNLMEAAQQTTRIPIVVSRSDSTLRGHFPGELGAISEALGQDFDAWILVPFFLEGGRYTIDDIHYVAEGEWLTPAGETEFARDPSFGYRTSDLRQWVEEKTGGKIRAKTVASISIKDIRLGGPDAVSRRLARLPVGSVCVVNAASMRDLEVFSEGLLVAEKGGQRFLCRTAASFVRARSGQSPRPLLTRAEMDLPESNGALIVVGSHVSRTNSQLTHLLRQYGILGIEVNSNDLLSRTLSSERIDSVAQQADQALRAGKDVVIFTAREMVTGTSAEDSLTIARHISEGVVAIVSAIESKPRYILAKGGNTASDIATKALNVERAMVPGQVSPGVPVWQLGPESRYPGLRYIVFPGNVGGPESLSEIVLALRQGE